MFKKRGERLYTKADINRAYSMGLEKAVVVLEASMLLSPADRHRTVRVTGKIVRIDSQGIGIRFRRGSIP